MTEFCQSVGYSQAFNTIDAAAGHQIEEASFLRSKFYDQDYIQLWTRNGGNSLQYTHWILDAALQRSYITGDLKFLGDQLPGMLAMWDEWQPFYDTNVSLYYYYPTKDAQEFSLPGYVAGPHNVTIQNRGPYTYRPSHNGYMIANARAIAMAASIANNQTVQENFTNIADTIETAMYQHLWDHQLNFFMDVIRTNNPNLTRLTGREEVGAFPYRFGVGLSTQYMNGAVHALFDPTSFLTQYGPTTLETSNQYYFALKPTTYCCYWNGQSWPFSTAQVLDSLAHIYRTGNSSLSAQQYYQYLRMYALTQYKDGIPYVAESHYPEIDRWSADSTNHSEHYDHSTNNYNVLTGLLGVVPQASDVFQINPIIPSNWTYFAIENLPYHSHLMTVIYDTTGQRYNMTPGLTIYMDGKQIHQQSSGISASVALPNNSMSASAMTPVNIAANPNGYSGFPYANATSTGGSDSPAKANDGYLFYDTTPDNRWTNNGSTSVNDTLQVTFPRPRNFSSVTLAIYSDRARGGVIDCPAAIELYGSNGLIKNVSNFKCLPNDRNTISFPMVESQFIAVNMFIKPSYGVGVCELEVWVPPNLGPNFYAVDEYVVGADVLNMNGTYVVGNMTNTTTVEFGGIQASSSNAQPIMLSYANNGSQVEVGMTVNFMNPTNLSFASTGNSFSTMNMTVPLLAGANVVQFTGGNENLQYEMLTVLV